MKKFLLSASVLMMASASAFAVTDGQTYAPVNGFNLENLWVLDRYHAETAYLASPIAVTSARTATTDGTTIYVGNSGAVATIEKYDVLTGEYKGSLPLTLGGEAFSGTLATNQVGFDEYGHFYCATYDATTDRSDATYKVYTVDLETGAITSVGELFFDGGPGRIDYCDVIGDITGAEANGTIMCITSAADNLNAFQWKLEQGTDEWIGGWQDGSIFQAVKGTCPDGAAGWNTGSVARMVRDGSKSGDMQMFYADGNFTFPALYGSDGSMIDNILNADLEKKTDGVVTSGTIPSPSAGTNGIAEGVVDDQNLMIYSECQPNDGAFGALAVITGVNGDLEMESMEYMWTIPADGLGKESDGGTRVHSLFCLPQEDGSALVLTFKCFNGVGVYKVSKDGGSVEGNVAANAVITVKGDVIAVSEVAESIEVYNVAGQKVAEVSNAAEVAVPAKGAYVVKAVVAGAPVVKKVVL